MSRFNIYEKVIKLRNVEDRIQKMKASGDDEALHKLEIVYRRTRNAELPLLLINNTNYLYYYFPDIDDILVTKNYIDGTVDLSEYIALKQSNQEFSDEIARFDSAVDIADEAISAINRAKSINSWDDLKGYLLNLYNFCLTTPGMDLVFLTSIHKNNSSK